MGWALSDHTLQRIARALLVLLFASLASGMLVPIYTDEVAWRIQLSRLVQDGWVDHRVSDVCGASTTIAPPLFMLPVRLFSSAVTAVGGGPLAVRLTGVALAMLAILLGRCVIARVAGDDRRRTLLDALFLALMGIGTLPFVLVWSRPEQPIWLMLLGALLIALAPRAAPLREPLARPLAIVACAAVALSYHPKATFYLPLFLVALWIAGRGATAWVRRAGLGALLVLLCGIGFSYWSRRLACPGDPILAAKIARESVAPLLLDGSIGEVVRLLPRIAWLVAPVHYSGLILPQRTFMSDWLPAVTLPYPVLLAWHGIAFLAWLALFVLMVAALVVAWRRRARPAPAQLLGTALIGCALLWGATQLNKNVYEAALSLPVFAVGALLVFADVPAFDRWLQRALLGIAAVSVVSQLLLVGHFAPRLWRADTPGYIAGQSFSTSPFGYAGVRAQVLQAGARCGFARPAAVRGLLIDDASYFAYAASRDPVYRLGVLSEWSGSIGDPLLWMHARGSPGAVVGCHVLPPAMRAIAIQTGAYCCLRTP